MWAGREGQVGTGQRLHPFRSEGGRVHDLGGEGVFRCCILLVSFVSWLFVHLFCSSRLYSLFCLFVRLFCHLFVSNRLSVCPETVLG